MEGLKFTPDYYKEKLILFAKDTVEVKTFYNLFNYKENSKGHPTVVEAFEDHFKIYTFTKSSEYARTGSCIAPTRDSFYANIYFRDNKISIETFWKKEDKILYLIGSLLIFGIAIIVGIIDNITFPILVILFLSISFIYLTISKMRYKKFILLFLESI